MLKAPLKTGDRAQNSRKKSTYIGKVGLFRRPLSKIAVKLGARLEKLQFATDSIDLNGKMRIWLPY